MADKNLELVRMAIDGDRSAFQQLLEQNYQMIHRIAYRYTGVADVADDIAQDVCVNLVDRLKSFRGDSSFKSWLYRLSINTCIDYSRKQKTRLNIAHQYTDMEKMLNADHSDSNKMVLWLYREVAQLKEPFRATALLVLGEDMSHAEAGHVLGCTESTISWRMHEIRKTLKVRKEASHE